VKGYLYNGPHQKKHETRHISSRIVAPSQLSLCIRRHDPPHEDHNNNFRYEYGPMYGEVVRRRVNSCTVDGPIPCLDPHNCYVLCNRFNSTTQRYSQSQAVVEEDRTDRVDL